jgi:hypothetical protein
MSEPSKGLKDPLTASFLEVGYMGEETGAKSLDALITSVTKHLSDLGVSTDCWTLANLG